MPTQKIVYIKREQKLFSSFASFCKEKIKENGRWLFERCQKYKKILKILVYIKKKIQRKTYQSRHPQNFIDGARENRSLLCAAQSQERKP